MVQTALRKMKRSENLFQTIPESNDENPLDRYRFRDSFYRNILDETVQKQARNGRLRTRGWPSKDPLM